MTSLLPTPLVFTIDIDWAPEAVIADTLALLTEYGARATLFATHASAVLRNCDRDRFEIALHPNFNPILDGRTVGLSADDVLDSLLAIYPEALGARSHSLAFSSSILDSMAKRGLVYESNQMMPYQPPVSPYLLWMGLVRIPYNWEDDIHFTYAYGFDQHRLTEGPGYNIVDFHPIHVFLNTEAAGRYNTARQHYHDPDALQPHVNRGPVPGARDLLVHFLQQHQRQPEPSPIMCELAAMVLEPQAVALPLAGVAE
jgi:hypothetical protein